MKVNTKIEWSNIEWWVHFYAYITLAVVIYGILAAHVPAIIGHPWTTCDEGGVGCIVTIHLFDVSMTLFNSLLVWYGLWRFSSIRVNSFLLLLVIGVAVNFVFFSFECSLIFDSFDRNAPTWEIVALFSIAILLLGGACLGTFLVLKLVLYIQYLPKPGQEGLELGIDGYYHPKTEEEIVALVKKAYKENLQVRCRGAAHSVAQSIYTNPGKGQPAVPNKVSEDTPPNGPNINIMLDQFKKLTWDNDEPNVVEAESGINLGADPGKSTLEESFLWKIWQKGWALEDLGGITHQTISGFMMTGSAGGTLMYDLVDNIEAFRIIDGTGAVAWIDKTNPEFFAMGTSLGLMGIITKIRFKLSPKYYIKGQEETTPTALADCQIDLFGSGTADKPSLETFFKETPYTRIMWWPQAGSERIVTWSASRETPYEPFTPNPYHEFSPSGLLTKLEELAAAILYTILGITSFIKILANILHDFSRFRSILGKQWGASIGGFLGFVFSFLFTLILGIIAFVPICILAIFRGIPLYFLPKIINIIQPLTSDKNPLKEFNDYYYSSLPMDNVVDDILMGTEFTEIWLPLDRTEEVMNLLHTHYKKNGYPATGAFSNELYAGHPSSFWMHQGYTDGTDAFKNGTIRVDLFWYTANDGTPNGKGEYYDQFWKLFRDAGIPFRLHWGKFVPDYDFKDWAAYYQTNLPKMSAFLTLREQRDPNNVFLTTYWEKRLYGI